MADPIPSFAYTEVFKKSFPMYMVMGMTYDQFWNDDVELVKYYREAFRLKQQLKEQDLWLQGAYFCEAIGACFSDKKNKATYPEKPHGYLGKRKETRNEPTAEQKSDNKAKVAMEMFMVNFNKRFEKKGGEENGS